MQKIPRSTFSWRPGPLCLCTSLKRNRKSVLARLFRRAGRSPLPRGGRGEGRPGGAGQAPPCPRRGLWLLWPSGLASIQRGGQAASLLGVVVAPARQRPQVSTPSVLRDSSSLNFGDCADKGPSRVLTRPPQIGKSQIAHKNFARVAIITSP